MNATGHEQVVEDILGLFAALPTRGEYPTYRDSAELSLQGLSPVELFDHLGDVAELLEGAHNTAEKMGPVFQMVHIDALERVREAQWKAGVAANIPGYR